MNVTVVLSKSPFMVQLMHATPEGQPIWIEVPNDPMYEEVSFRSTFSFRRLFDPCPPGRGNSFGISLWYAPLIHGIVLCAEWTFMPRSFTRPFGD